jgi:mono/diheme cytochrome c family protein
MKIRKITSLAALPLVALWVAGFGSTSFSAQPVPAQQPEVTSQQYQDSVLTAGRSLYLNNCNRCHALPDVRFYSAPRLTAIVDKMSRKAQMTAEQHDAVLKYLQTIRAM